MAAYCRLDDLVTCGLSACTPWSALGPTSMGSLYHFIMHTKQLNGERLKVPPKTLHTGGLKSKQPEKSVKNWQFFGINLLCLPVMSSCLSVDNVHHRQLCLNFAVAICCPPPPLLSSFTSSGQNHGRHLAQVFLQAGRSFKAPTWTDESLLLDLSFAHPSVITALLRLWHQYCT